MPTNLEKMVGNVFGFWTVINVSTQKYKVDCLCKCGIKKSIQARALVAGKSRSCGCNKGAVCSQKAKTHGLTKTKEHHIWVAMKQRCINPNNKAYMRYGGRGIKVCDKWMNSFPAFLLDMGNKPDGLSIERIDNDGNYEPSNCKWATRLEQNLNQRLQKRNKSGYKNIRWREERHGWETYKRIRGKRIYLGLFTSKQEAINAQNK